MNPSNLRGPALDDAQWAQVRSLADSLDPQQLSWLSGFLAGVVHGRRPGTVPLGAGPSAASAQAAVDAIAAASDDEAWAVIHASETGNSAEIARQLGSRLSAAGRPVRVLDVADVKPRQLAQWRTVLVVASTHGDGDPPQSAMGFFEFLDGRKAPRLERLRYAVLALGDSTYQQFCATGRRIDERLSALGGERLLPRVDCDVDYEGPAAAWIATLVEKLAGADARTGGDTERGAVRIDGTSVTTRAADVHAETAAKADRQHPASARVLDNLVLTGRGSSKEVRHIELSIDEAALPYRPGDALGLIVPNDPALIEALLDATRLSGDARVELKGRSMPLAQALATELDIVNVAPRFLEYWSRQARAPALAELAAPERGADRHAFARTHHLIDVVRRFPAAELDADNWASALRPLQPRLYSIASSAAAVPGEVHLTVAGVRYELFGEPRQGVASGFLGNRAGPDAELSVYVQPAPHFRLPADDAPIIMIGAGTGIAPYRAFLQEREARGASGRAWLFFGERRFRTDFLYQTEWQGWLKDGLLDRMDVAFSRDGGTDGGKTYVWHRLLERARDVHDWLEQGACLYVCGDATQMAPDVHRALGTVVAGQRGCDAEGAQAYLRQLQETHRYQRDVY
ncbi:MAG: flavodoxin domain-containing protein [Burkholderiaceae bacterium]